MRRLLSVGVRAPRYWAVAAISVWCTAAVAQSPANPLERQVDEAFRQVIQAPGDAAAGTSYARLLIDAGNYEGGIAALERLLLNPDAPATVPLELAVLYYRLGSYSMSESMLQRALDDPRLQGEQRVLADTLLRDTRKRSQVSRLDGMLMLGLRAQTNPTARTDSNVVLGGGLPVTLPDAFKPKSDTDAQALLRLDHSYDLGFQNEAAVVSSLVAQVINFHSSSGSRLQANQTTPYDLALAEITSGIRFKPMPSSLSGLTIRPHLIAATLTAQGHRYLDSAGAGIDGDYRIDEKTLLGAAYEYRNFSYASRIDVPAASVLGGPENLLRLRLSRELAPGHVLIGELVARVHRTERAYYDYDTKEARLTYSVSYANPFRQGGGFWNTAVWGGALRRSYDGADPAVDAQRQRRETEWRIGIGQTVPLWADLSLLVQVEHLKTSANIPNFRNKNTSLFGAMIYRF